MADQFLTKEEQKQNSILIEKRFKNVVRKGVDREIALDNAVSASDIQAFIDAQLKYIPYGKTLLFQFADGNYSLDASLIFAGFFGGGNLHVYGNATNNSLSTTKAVFLDFNNDTHGFQFLNNSVHVECNYFKIGVDTAAGDYAGIYNRYNANFVSLRYNYVLGDGGKGAGYNACIKFDENSGYGQVRDTYVSNARFGILNAASSPIETSNNDDTGTLPAYGMGAYRGNIHQLGAQSPAGSSGATIFVDAEIY